jgi:hypothetical protein
LSADRFRFFGKGVSAFALAAIGVVASQSCGFPDHQFIQDKDFYAKGSGAKKGSGGATSPDGALSEGGAFENGGAGPSSGGNRSAGGNPGGQPGTGDRPGAGADGGIIAIREGGRAPGTGGDPGAGGAGPGDGGGGEPGDAGPMCPPGLDTCDGVCRDFQADNAHCGDCVTVCTGSDVCTAGKCAPPCAPGLSTCTPTGSTVKTCVDTTLDENHCGGCNKPCPGGTVCEGSKCLVDCGATTRCGTQCFDTTTDDLHCGNCTTNCKLLNQVCSGSVCKTTCTPPYIACNNTCVNPANDDLNCGGCNKPCGATQGCIGGVCKTLVENCTNGIDDDRDNLIDCADPNCTAGYTCGSVPAGWQGPFALWSGSPNAAPSCPAAFPTALFLAHDKLTNPAYSCPSCGCAPSGGASCNTLHFWYDTTNNCTASGAWDVAVDPDGVCVPETLSLFSQSLNPLSMSINSAQLTPADRHNPPLPPYAQGGCTPNQVTPNFPDPTWGLDAEGCGAAAGAATGGGCGIGQCMPKPTTPFGGKLCISKAGVASCPSSYPVSPASSPQYYETWSDSRKCSACSCGSVTCGGTITAFTDLACHDNPTPIDMAGSCSTIPRDPSPSGTGKNKNDTLSIRWDNGGPVCGQSPSNVLGALSPDSPITVCCQQ